MKSKRIAGNPLDISSGLYAVTAKQYYTKAFTKKCTTAEQSYAGRKEEKKKKKQQNWKTF